MDPFFKALISSVGVVALGGTSLLFGALLTRHFADPAKRQALAALIALALFLVGFFGGRRLLS